MVSEMKEIIIPEGENDGLAPYNDHPGFKDHNVHVLSLWHKNYWAEHGQTGSFCEHFRIVPEDTKICYSGHGNIWNDVYKQGQIVCTLMTYSKSNCSIGEKLLNGETIPVQLTAKASPQHNHGLEMVVSDLTFTCPGKVEIEPKIKEN